MLWLKRQLDYQASMMEKALEVPSHHYPTTNDAVNDAVRAIVSTLRSAGIRFAPPVDIAIVGDPTAPVAQVDPPAAAPGGSG